MIAFALDSDERYIDYGVCRGSVMKSAARVRAAEKSDLSFGQWHHGKRMPKTAFTLRKSSGYVLGASWSWRVIRFKADGQAYKILLAFRPDRMAFLGALAHDSTDATILCRVEHHGSHPGWHVHYQSQAPFQSGVFVNCGEIRRSCGKDSPYGPSMVREFESWATTVAVGLFNLPPETGSAGELL